jgi:hypothetical protein
MIYTSGIILNPDVEESLEQLQDNKLAVVCNKLDLKPTDKYVANQTFMSELNRRLIDFSTLVAVGELLLPMLQRILDAMLLVLPSVKINTNSALNASPRTA